MSKLALYVGPSNGLQSMEVHAGADDNQLYIREMRTLDQVSLQPPSPWAWCQLM